MGLTAPTRLPSGATVWLDGEVIEFTRRLTELDPRLALVKNPDASWSIYRVAEDGSEHVIAKSPPHARLSFDVIERLRRGDTRAPGNRPIEVIIAENERNMARLAEKEHEAMFLAVDEMLSKSWRGPIRSTIDDEDV